jgi:hypothetical protein
MSRKLWPPLAALATVALIGAGCGSNAPAGTTAAGASSSGSAGNTASASGSGTAGTDVSTKATKRETAVKFVRARRPSLS